MHIYANGQPKAGPVRISPLTNLRGEHVATVRFDAIEHVPEFRASRVSRVRRSTAPSACRQIGGVASVLLLLPSPLPRMRELPAQAD